MFYQKKDTSEKEMDNDRTSIKQLNSNSMEGHIT